jgi:glucose dehydrogenase
MTASSARVLARVGQAVGLATVLSVCLLLRDMGHAGGADASRYTTWRDYGGSPDSMQYSALEQINRTTVKQLAPEWFYPVQGEATRLPFNPLMSRQP